MAQLSGVKKAAILMISLGSEASSQVMKLLPDSMIQKVSYEIANTDYVTPEEKNAVIDELVDTATARQFVLDGGIDYAKDLLVNSLGPQRAKEVLDVLNTIQLREQPFNIARRANEQQLVNLLVEEHPQTIALILCYMRAEKAASVLSEFPDELQSDVAERVATISATSPETIQRIEKVMEDKFSNVVDGERENIGGVGALVDILNSTGRSTEKTILAGLESRQPELASEVQANLFTFEDITTLQALDVQKVLRDVTNDVLELALKGSDDRIKDFIFGNMSQRAVENIKEDLEFMGPTRLSAVEEAQQKVVAVIRKLDERGEIYIGRGGQDSIV